MNSLPLNPFQSVRPRGKDTAPTPRQRKQTIGPRPTVKRRVMNSKGILQASLEPDAGRSIVIESRAQSQASRDKRSRISKGGTK